MRALKGFTLLELLIVIAIAAVMLGLGVPGMRAFALAGSRSEASISLYGAMVEARAEAISRNTWVLLCARDPSMANTAPKCQPAAGSANWSSGWVLLRDANNNGVLDSGEPAAIDVIAAGDASDASLTLAPLPATPNYLSFASSGRPSAALSFTLCKTGDRSFAGRSITVDAGGHVALAPCTCT